MNELAIGEDKVALIKKMFAVGASDQELEVFLYTCRRTGLDPLARQIYFVKRGGKMVIQTGIDGYRVVADRTGKYAGNDDPVFDREEKPTRATVTVYKLVEGQRCGFTATARWDQYYPGKGQSPLWDKMPHLMLGKCAEALSLRKAFPQDLSGIYTAEEMDQAGQEDLPKAGLGPDRRGLEGRGLARHGVAGEEGGGQKAPETLPKDRFVEKLGDKLFWQETIRDVVKHEGENAKGKWTLFRINTDDPEHTATTFDEALARDAEIMIDQKVRVLYEANKRKPGTFTYLGFEPIEQVVPASTTQDELGWQEPKEKAPF